MELLHRTPLCKNSPLNFTKLKDFYSSAAGPAQSYQSMYPPPGCYGAPPHQQSYPTIPTHPAPNKAPITNSAQYYQGNHHHHHQQQHVATPPYTTPLSSAPPPQPYAAPTPSQRPPLPPPNAQYNQQQHPPYTTPGSYYGQQSYSTPLAQQQHQQQPSLVAAPASGPGAPVYPIVSYPSAPGSSQFGTLSSSHQSPPPGPGLMPTQIRAPLHQYGTSQPAFTAAGQPGYGGDVVPMVNGQGASGLWEA